MGGIITLPECPPEVQKGFHIYSISVLSARSLQRMFPTLSDFSENMYVFCGQEKLAKNETSVHVCNLSRNNVELEC